jgi:hypothetical protein
MTRAVDKDDEMPCETWNDEAAILDVLGRWLTGHGGEITQASVSFNPAVWMPRLSACSSALAVLGEFVPRTGGMGLISRADLRAVARRTIGDDPIPLFTACMIWGSGRTNGRGPRNTQAALNCPDLEGRLKAAVELIRADNPGVAYQRTRIPGVGKPFLTKYLWAVGTTLELSEVRPLILDSRVWASLGTLCWSSLEAAGTSSWAARYEAYLTAMKQWAGALQTTPETLELLLFQQNGQP